MTDTDDTSSAPRKGGHPPWRKGQSGNPKGRRAGTRPKFVAALDSVGEEASQDIVNATITAAKAGDMTAAEMILRRCWPARKGQPIRLDLPYLGNVKDLVQASAHIVAAVAAGGLTPEEGAAVATLLEHHRRTIETTDLAARIEALEAAAGTTGATADA
jgi:hypothetical protein